MSTTAQTGIQFGVEVKITIERLTKPTLPMPVNPPEDATATAKRIWERHVDAYGKAETTLDSDKKRCIPLSTDSAQIASEQSVKQSPTTQQPLKTPTRLASLRTIFSVQSQK